MGTRRHFLQRTLAAGAGLSVGFPTLANQGAELSADGDFLTDRGNLSSLSIAAGAAKPPQSVTTVVGALKVHIPLSGLVDLSKVKVQLDKREQTLAKSISGKEGRLANADYVARAPADQVAETKLLLERERAELANVRETLATL